MKDLQIAYDEIKTKHKEESKKLYNVCTAFTFSRVIFVLFIRLLNSTDQLVSGKIGAYYEIG